METGHSIGTAPQPRHVAPRTAPRKRVLGVIGEPMNGVGYVRFHQPFAHLQELGYELTTLGPSLELTRGATGWEPAHSLLDDVSLLIFPQFVPSPTLADGRRVDVVGSLCREARSRGIPIVYSADDSLAHLQPDNPEWSRIGPSLDNLGTILDHATAIVVTTDELQRSLASRDRPVYVVPNAVDPAHWGSRPNARSGTAIGWTGSSSHLDDLLMLLPVIHDLQRRNSFRFVLQGLTDVRLERQITRIRRDRAGFDEAQRTRADRFLELCGQLRRIHHLHVPFCETAKFFDLLPALDLEIGVCPLLDTPFNRHKSANKFYEYAVTGTMTVASRVTPYREEVSVTAPNDPDAWREMLEGYLRDPGTREDELRRQREFVLTERNIERLKDRWAEVLGAILGRRG